jgi:hypothetical protein
MQDKYQEAAHPDRVLQLFFAAIKPPMTPEIN